MTWKPRADVLSFEEMLRVARLCADMGVRKIRLTGGEPTVRRGIETLIHGLAGLPGVDEVALTTNGVRLSELAYTLRDHGLHRVNVSLDTLRPERFAAITGRDDFARVLDGIATALQAGFHPLKLNVVVLAGINDDEVFDFIEFVRDRPINLRFIEYMPFKGNGWDAPGFLPAAELLQRIGAYYPLIPVPRVDASAVATDYRITDIRGTVSVISALSDSFCAQCSRLRLMADGSVKSCLFHPAEVNLRDALRGEASDRAIVALLRAAIAQKPAAHPAADVLAALADRHMVEIGG